MNKLRSVNTRFWEDPFVEGLKPEEKLLFLYLLTNPLTNLIGIYEISEKRMSYDTGLTIERIRKALKAFNPKVVYTDNYVILPNFLKNQNLNTNMQKGAMKIYDELPNWLKDSINDKPLKAFESLRNALLNMNRIEYEEEDELKDELKVNIVFDIFWNLYDKKVGDKNACEKKWNKLKDEERQKIIDTLPEFLAYYTDKQFQPFPTTYLNQRRWNDEQYQAWDVKKEDQSDFSEYDQN